MKMVDDLGTIMSGLIVVSAVVTLAAWMCFEEFVKEERLRLERDVIKGD